MGDPSRLLPLVKNGRSGYFVQQNRGKKSLCLDFAKPEAIELLCSIVRKADVVVENYDRLVSDLRLKNGRRADARDPGDPSRLASRYPRAASVDSSASRIRISNANISRCGNTLGALRQADEVLDTPKHPRIRALVESDSAIPRPSSQFRQGDRDRAVGAQRTVLRALPRQRHGSERTRRSLP